MAMFVLRVCELLFVWIWLVVVFWFLLFLSVVGLYVNSVVIVSVLWCAFDLCLLILVCLI